MNNLPSISEAEYEVMKIVWAEAPVSTNQVVDKLLKTSSWTEKTIQSMLARLVKKGVLDYQKQSRVYVYTPLISEDEYLEHKSSAFLNKFYSGTINSMVVNLLEKDKLSKDDISALKKILDEKLAEGGN